MSDSDEGQAGVPLFEGFSGSASPQPLSTTKRKREVLSKPEEKSTAKRRKLKKPKDVDDEALDVELGVNHAIAHMGSQLMADHVAQRTKRYQPELSLVEAEDYYIPEKAIIDTTGWEKPRTKDQLPNFLEHFAGSKRKKKGQKLGNAPQEKGHPHTLVLAGAGLRAADLTRSLRQFQTKEALVAKLFAKHIKLKEAVEFVSKSRINIGVGTPQRVSDLLDNGVLSSSHLERIVVDASYIDQKKRGVLDMKELQVPLVQLLARKELKERYGGGESKIELLFF
ncbi:Protein cms1 [Vermiconidia calcicola]|uniref:Protein cms1 n=1 Tax=Vermiconidia calcicola TaxID=1690605 RepID=A0ACC3MQ66_9PEZI|nr:Protein cms1 [Vermiconidia calcicola]